MSLRDIDYDLDSASSNTDQGEMESRGVLAGSMDLPDVLSGPNQTLRGENEDMEMYVIYDANLRNTSKWKRLMSGKIVGSIELRVLQLETKARAAEWKFEQQRVVEDIDEAIEYRGEILSLIPEGHEDRARRFGELGTALLRRFMRIGKLTDLNMAIEHQTQAVPLAPEGHPHKIVSLENLGNSYQSRFEFLGEPADLEKAIELQTQVVLLTPDGHPQRPSRLNNLGTSYEYQFKRLGKLADLDKAIDYHMQAVLLTPDGHPHKPSWLNNLGASYLSRFEHLSELADLDRAIECQTQMILLTPDGHPHKPTQLSNLGISYQSRFKRLGELADVDKAIDYQTQAAPLTPDGHPHKPSVLNNLGVSYQSRFEHLGELADLDKAIDCQTQVNLLTPDRHPYKPATLNNIGNSYGLRFRQLGELADLNKAIGYQTRAVLLVPDGHSNKPSWLNNLGGSYHSRFERLGNLSDLELARLSFQQGAQLILTHPESQLWCARKWAKCASLLSLSQRSAYERCMELLPHRIWLGTTIDQRYTLITELIDLATEAAAWAISAQDFDLALEWLEEGRSIVWNQILQLRSPFDNLSSVNPMLAQELKDTASKLELAGSRQAATLLPINQSSDLEKDVQDHHHLASKWEKLLEEARVIPGFHNFLRPRKATELRLAATDGPVVVLNAHSTRCDALIIFPQCNDIAHLPLSRLSPAKLEEFCVRLDSLIGHQEGRARGLKLLRHVSNPEDQFKDILAALWSDIVQPILETITCTHTGLADELPHVTWCTTGALSFLPLHAAGCYDGSQPSAFELMLSSYAPTLTSLLSSSVPLPTPTIGVLVVGQEHTQDLGSLPNTVPEIAAIKSQAMTIRFRQLEGENATVDAVLRAMDEYSWVHLACHATQNSFNPAHSSFHLHDGNLTLEAITKHAFKHKGLAFLSACQTAAGDRKLPDEAVHLAAGMLMAGYPSVIATMWSIYDEDAPKVAGKVYAQLLNEGQMDHRQAARALHRAVAGLRERVGDKEFKRWVPFIHMGN